MARITITDAEHDRLLALGDGTLRRIVSETTDQIGLGAFTPVTTKADGTPKKGTDWFTAHPDLNANAANALPVLAARLKFALKPANKAKMRRLVKDVDGEKENDDDDEYTKQPIDDDERKRRWKAAGGDDKKIEHGKRKAKRVKSI